MRLTWIYAALLTLLVGAALVPFHLNPDAFMADDAYFYLQVADHIRQGHGSTFHEITQTNGYHPLWMLCCVVGAFISGGDKTVLLQLMAFVQDGLFLASIFLLWRCGRAALFLPVSHWQKTCKKKLAENWQKTGSFFARPNF